MHALRNTLSGAVVTALLFASPSFAQVPVDSSGQPIGDYADDERAFETGKEGIPLLESADLEELVGPVALYPDDLLAIVLPASTFPLQLVQAKRFLDDLETDSTLRPDEDWDDSVVALLNYPEVLELLNDDLDWTWQLGEAVVAQHADVVAAVEDFRNRAFAAGNLHSDERQVISDDNGAIQISPADDDIIYVPYYEPENVVVYQSEPVVHYYPHAYPVYYYPYPSGHAFRSGFFWGVTTAYSLGWLTDRVHVVHHSHRSHPYYGRDYWRGWWYRRPSVHVHNHYYSNNRVTVNRQHYSRGNVWRPTRESRRRLSNQRIVQSGYYVRGNEGQRARVTRTRSMANTERPRMDSVPARDRSEQRPARYRSKERAAGNRSEQRPARYRSEERATVNRAEQRPTGYRSEQRPIRPQSERRPAGDRNEKRSVRNDTESRSARERNERPRSESHRGKRKRR